MANINTNYTFDNFDYQYYLTENSDLIVSNIKTKKQAWRHWNSFGYKENRPNRKITDIITFKNLNFLIDYLIEKDINTNNFLNEIISQFYTEVTVFRTQDYINYFRKALSNSEINNNEYIDIMKNQRSNCLDIIKNDFSIDQINKISHKVWLTDDSNPYMPSDKMLQNLKIHCSELIDFKHYLWCNNREIGNKIINQNKNLEFKDINELENPEDLSIVKLLLKKKLFANACDIIRIQIINKYGGLYSDFGWIINKYTSFYISNFDLMFNGEMTEWCKGYVSHNVIYSKQKEQLIFSKMVSLLKDKIFLKNLWNCNPSFITIIEVVSPRFIMAMIPILCLELKIIVLRQHITTYSKHNTHSHVHGTFGSNKIQTIEREISNDVINYLNKV